MLLLFKSFGSNKLWPLFPKASLAMAVFLVVAVLYHSCSACNSKLVLASLSLGVQHSAVRKSDGLTERKRPVDPIVPSRSGADDDAEKYHDPISGLADSSWQQNRSVDQIALRSAPQQKNSRLVGNALRSGSSADDELRDSQAKREGYGGSSKDVPSSTRAENENPNPDHSAFEIKRLETDETANGLRNPQLADIEFPPSSREAGPAREPPSQDPDEISSPSSEKPASLLELEQDLSTAKQAIAMAAEAPLPRGAYLHAALYHNVSKFKKSYELMERMFRIFVYNEGAPPLVHGGPTVGIYASEGRLIHLLQRNRQFVVKDPTKAHMFFLPYSVANMVIKLYVPDSHSMLPLTDFVTNYVNLIASKHPFWNRTQGADHFFVSCHDWGPATARGHVQLRQNSVKVVCNADLTEEFVLHRDISLPEIYLHAAKPPTAKELGGPPPGSNRRPYLAFFAGHMHGRVRPILLQLWKNKDPSMKIYEMLPATVAKKRSYVRHMKMSKFCICAMGYEVNSPRIVEAIYYDCVPVIIADNFVLPFSEVLKWEAFSVVVKEEELPFLKQILMSIPAETYNAMQARLKHVRQHFLWHHHHPVKYDAFHMILHSLWLTRLASDLRPLQTSPPNPLQSLLA